ncbi:MAG: hypothetical protein FJW20_12640 [Acidimicrobiia bacterium]|nr:hypothetical protein [Acidimicrobiia bacterium]
MQLVTDEIYKPNGICFSPDYRRLYVGDTGSTHIPEAPRTRLAHPAGDDHLSRSDLIKGRAFTEGEIGKVGSLPFFMGACGNWRVGS